MLEGIRQEFKRGRTLLQFGFLQVLGRIVAMLMPLVVAKFFSKDLFGRYSLSEMVIFFFVAFLVTSIKTAFVVCANQERAGSGRINKSFTAQSIFALVSVFLFLAVGVIFGKYLMMFAKISGADLFFLGLGFLGIALKEFTANVFMALNERIKQAVVDLVFGLAAILCIFLFCMMDWINLKAVFLAYFISSMVVFFIFVSVVDFTLLLPFEFDKRHFMEMVHFTKWVTFGVSSVYFINWGGNLVLRYYNVQMDNIGVYNFAYKFFKGFTILVYVVPNYFLPFISENINNPEKMKDYLSNKRPKLFLLGVVILIMAFFITPYFLNFIYQDKFDDSVSVIRILLIASGLLLYTAFYGPVFFALKKFKIPYVVGVVQVVLNLVLNLVLVPVFGIQGAAMATVLAYLSFTVLNELYFQLRLKELVGVGNL